ncbi:MAG TPA: polyphenol oxidase family protein [bacterium]|jgi:hypothetical protein
MFQLHRAGDLLVLRTDLFPLTVPHAFTTRRLSITDKQPGQPGPANFRVDSISETCEWWTKLRDSLFTPIHICYLHKQVHGNTVRILDFENLPGDERSESGFSFRILGEGDGMIKPFTRRNVFIGVTTADCLPILIYDQNSHTTGVVHAGWRSVAADIIEKAFTGFVKTFDAKPTDLLWAAGPSIDIDHYEVGPEVIAALETAGYSDADWDILPDRRPGWTPGRGDRYMLSLSTCLNIRLRKLGIPDENIDICKLSTYTNKVNFFSYRREGKVIGLQASVIG